MSTLKLTRHTRRQKTQSKETEQASERMRYSRKVGFIRLGTKKLTKIYILRALMEKVDNMEEQIDG